MNPRTPLAALIAAALGLLPVAVRANGRFPEAQHLVGGPRGEEALLALRTTFGLARSADRGQRWTFFCEDLLGLAGGTWDAPIQLGREGTLFAGVPDGLIRLGDGCGAPRVTEVGGDFSADLTATSDGATILWVGSRGPAGNRVLASTDGGVSFAPRGTARDGLLVETIEVSDALPERVYATAAQLEPRALLLLRSDDGARTLREFPLSRNDLDNAFLAGIDPQDPDGVWLRAPLRGGPSAGSTALLHSRDGGARFEEVARTAGPMLGFTIAADGAVFFGGPDDGLWRGRPGSFARVADTPVTCLRWHDGALYACANHVRAGWAVGRSTDRGARFEPVLRFDALSVPAGCAAGSIGAEVCPGRWSVLRAALTPDAGSGATTRDAAAPGAPPAPAATACATAPRRAWGRGRALALLAALALRRRRRA